MDYQDQEVFSNLFNRYQDDGVISPPNPESKVTAKYVAHGSDGQDSYGDPTGAIWLVFEVGGQHYKVTGYRSSYDGTSWDGTPKPAEKKVVEVWA